MRPTTSTGSMAGVAFILSGCFSMPTGDLTSNVKATPPVLVAPKAAQCVATVSSSAPNDRAQPSLVLRSDAVAVTVPELLQSFDTVLPAAEPDFAAVFAVKSNLVRSKLEAGAAQLVHPTAAPAPPVRPADNASAGAKAEFQIASVQYHNDLAAYQTTYDAEGKQATSDALRQANSLARSISVKSAATRLALLRSSTPSELQTDKVFNALVDGVRQTVVRAQADIARPANLPDSIGSVGTVTPPTSVNLTENDFKAFAKTIRNVLVSPTLAVGALQSGSPVSTAADSGDSVSFKSAFVSYFSAYYKGAFVNRFGTKLTKPAISRTISDAEIASAVQVMWELVFDYTLHTPVWKSGSTYYPGATKEIPTAVAVKLIVAQDLLADADSKHCGITSLKADAIEYLSNAAADRAAALGGLVGSSFGGIHFGFGIMGKISIGDNQLLQAVVKTSLSETAGRAAEEASYRALYWIPYNGETLIADLVQQYLDGNAPKP
jgi:hypothetical protein